MSDRILIIPGGPFQIPLIDAAKRRDLKVVVADANANAPGMARADFADLINPTDIDALVDVAKHHDIRAVVSMASDPCVIPCAAVAEALALPGLPVRVAQRARNKHASLLRIREIAPELCPRFQVIPDAQQAADIANAIGFPLVLKPQAANGSKGVVIVDRAEDLPRWIAYVKTFAGDLPIVAEERLTGAEVSIETWSVDGEVHVVAIVDKITSPPPYCVEIGHTTPSRLPRNQIEQLAEAVRKIVGALEIENGPAHNELFMTAAGPKFVETGARLGGGCIASHLVPISTGVDMIEAALDLALGKRVQLEPTRAKGAAIRFLRPPLGMVSSVTGLDRARAGEGILEVSCTLKPGSRIAPMENSDHRVGYVMAEGGDAHEAAQRAERAVEEIKFEIS